MSIQLPAVAPAGGASSFSAAYGVSGGPFLDYPNVIAFVDAPALSTAQLPNGETVTYTLVEGNDPTFATVTGTTVMGVQTGAGGIGAASTTVANRLKLAGGQYWGLKITASASANVSGLAVSLKAAKTI